MPDNSSANSYISGLLQGKAYRVLQNHLTEVLSKEGLSIPEWKLLGQLIDRGPTKMNDLAVLLDIEPPLVTKLLITLVKKELVVKNPSSSDQRIVILSPTPKGTSVITKVEPLVRAEMRLLLGGVSPEELQTYLKILSLIVKNGKTKKRERSDIQRSY